MKLLHVSCSIHFRTSKIECFLISFSTGVCFAPVTFATSLSIVWNFEDNIRSLAVVFLYILSKFDVRDSVLSRVVPKYLYVLVIGKLLATFGKLLSSAKQHPFRFSFLQINY